MKYTVVTSINRHYWENEGVQLNLQSWDKFFPRNIEIHVYSEDLQPADIKLSDRVIVHDLYRQCPDLVTFKNTHSEDPHYNGTKGTPNYKWNGIKFAHKTFAIFKQAQETRKGILIWLDADVLAVQHLDHTRFASICPNPYAVNYLGRPDTHSECGYVTYNLDHEHGMKFVKHFQSYYFNSKLSTISQTHDSFVFDEARKTYGHSSAFNNLNKHSKTNKHPFDKTILNQFFVHTKGDQKERRVIKNAKRFRLSRFNLHASGSNQ